MNHRRTWPAKIVSSEKPRGPSSTSVAKITEFAPEPGHVIGPPGDLADCLALNRLSGQTRHYRGYPELLP
jgi:hypothetical protein